MWVRDIEGERLIAYVAERREAVSFAFKVWAIRGRDRLEVTLRRPERGQAPAIYELVASNLHTRRGIPGAVLGDDRDNPCECERHGPVVALPVDWCYLETMKHATPPEVSTPVTARAKAFRHLNVRVSTEVRAILASLVAVRTPAGHTTGAILVEELIRAEAARECPTSLGGLKA